MALDYRDRVKDLFAKNQVSINEFSKINKIGQSHLSAVVRKEKNRHLTIEQLIIICDYFGVSADSILFGNSNKFEELERLKSKYISMQKQEEFSFSMLTLMMDIEDQLQKYRKRFIEKFPTEYRTFKKNISSPDN